ncbi:MAG TPA: tripartite tricarboxylate transporter substrate binding protein [Ramlibacter sp.]|nr:tripartite tricarboxylate transporter substrate binding protein [Ramlibacter sp.]
MSMLFHPSILRTVRSVSLVAAALLGGVAIAADVASYPSKPIRIIVPFAAGGGVDATARLIGEQLAKKLGQPVYIDNKPGAGGLIAVRQTIASPADGHTLFLGAAGEIVINPVLNKDAGYDPKKDLVPVAIVVRAPNVLAVNADVPANSVAELVDYARKNPGKLSFSSSGIGTIQHITGEVFNKVAGIDVFHVPYPGAAAATIDVASKRVSMTFSSPGAVSPFVQKGQMKMLGVVMSKRYPALPDLPTVQESPGMAAFDVESWFAMFAPANTPAPVVRRLNAEVREAMKTPEVAEKLIKGVGMPSFEDEVQAKAFVANEIAKYARILRDLNIKP